MPNIPVHISILREAYCRLVGDVTSVPVREAGPFIREGRFSGQSGETFWTEILFGVPELDGYEFSARLELYVPLPRSERDVFVRCSAFDGEDVSPEAPFSVTIFRDGQFGGEDRHELCEVANNTLQRIIMEVKAEFFREK